MTVNERIAQKRKEQSLSQEALGEMLGVSRQAIYKWESGAALPEIEKLVAMSRIFSVSVGWLLGVEDGGEAASDGKAESGELSDAQLKMVEEIAARYQAALPAPPKRRRWPFVLATLVLIAVFIRLFSQLSALQNDFRSVQNTVNYIDSSVDSRIGSITNQVENVLERVNSFTVSHSAEIVGADLLANTVTFSLRAEPKTYTEGMRAVFQAVWGGEIIEVEAQMDENRVFSAELSCPLTDEIWLSVAFISGTTRETQSMETFRDLYSMSFPYMHISLPTLDFELEGDVFIARSYHVRPHTYDYGKEGIPVAKAVDYKLGLFKNRELVFWLDKLDSQPEDYIGDWSGSVFFRNPTDYTLERDSEYCLAMLVTDEFGRERILSDTPIVFHADESDKNGGDWDFPESYTRSEDPADWKY